MIEHLHFEKAGRRFEILSHGDGKIPAECKAPCCANLPKANRYSLLPCGCHSPIVLCTCKIKERVCNKCKRVFVQMPAYSVKGKRFVDWYETHDPHAPATGGKP